jgi:hypothetical protein
MGSEELRGLEKAFDLAIDPSETVQRVGLKTRPGATLIPEIASGAVLATHFDSDRFGSSVLEVRERRRRHRSATATSGS